MNIPNGMEPAFPFQCTTGPEIYYGLTLRDYLAAKAMQGICTHVDIWGPQSTSITEAAYQIADAMIAERAK